MTGGNPMLRTRPLSLSAFGVGVALTLAFATSAYALPVGSEDDPHESLPIPSTWEEIESASVDFTAIIALSNCSGSLVRFTTSKPDDFAMVLTNGHCLTFLDPGDAVYHEASTRSFSLLNAKA